MLRDYQPADAEAIVRVALAAFAEFEQDYSRLAVVYDPCREDAGAS